MLEMAWVGWGRGRREIVAGGIGRSCDTGKRRGWLNGCGAFQGISLRASGEIVDVLCCVVCRGRRIRKPVVKPVGTALQD